jgi:hypothetical protein
MIGQVGRGWFLVTSELEQRVRLALGLRRIQKSGGKVATTEFSTLD